MVYDKKSWEKILKLFSKMFFDVCFEFVEPYNVLALDWKLKFDRKVVQEAEYEHSFLNIKRNIIKNWLAIFLKQFTKMLSKKKLKEIYQMYGIQFDMDAKIKKIRKLFKGRNFDYSLLADLVNCNYLSDSLFNEKLFKAIYNELVYIVHFSKMVFIRSFDYRLHATIGHDQFDPNGQNAFRLQYDSDTFVYDSNYPTHGKISSFKSSLSHFISCSLRWLVFDYANNQVVFKNIFFDNYVKLFNEDNILTRFVYDIGNCQQDSLRVQIIDFNFKICQHMRFSRHNIAVFHLENYNHVSQKEKLKKDWEKYMDEFNQFKSFVNSIQ